MILSDTDILTSISKGELVIEPFVRERLRPGSYRYTLGKHLSKPLPVSEPIDVRKKNNLPYERIEISAEGYVLQPGEFILGQIAESLSLSTNLASFTDGRTQLARLGLEVVMSSMFVEPGQKGSRETLEISNSGPSPILLFAGMPIAKGIFMRTESPASQAYNEAGTYAHQNSPEPILGQTQEEA